MKYGAVPALMLVGSPVFANITQADADGIVTAILASVAIAAAAGLTIMAAVLGWDVGMSLIKKFTKRGAR